MRDGEVDGLIAYVVDPQAPAACRVALVKIGAPGVHRVSVNTSAMSELEVRSFVDNANRRLGRTDEQSALAQTQVERCSVEFSASIHAARWGL